MAETSANINSTGTTPVDGVAITVTPVALSAGQSIRQAVAIGDGSDTGNFSTVKAASTAAVLSDTGLVVLQSPNSSPSTSGTSSLSNVTASASSVTLLAANANRRACYLVNDSTATLYLTFGSGASSTTSYSLQIQPSGILTPDNVTWRGAITGIWSAANGAARITELT